MYYYIKSRKKGTCEWKALRQDGKIIVLNNFEKAKEKIASMADHACKIVTMKKHPSDKESRIKGKSFLKEDW
ncbi:MAG TPA: hypothetical protein VFF28_06465 [Candidatus Nanoarchaeia archaeon]|nr:hypothetical protein [Candidatus Nanoarchaeia archaeon]